LASTTTTTATTTNGSPLHSDRPLLQRNNDHYYVWGNPPSDDHDDATRRRRTEGTASATARSIAAGTATPHSVTTVQDEYPSDDGDAYDDDNDDEPPQQDVFDAVSYAEPAPDIVASMVAASSASPRRSSQRCFDAALAQALDQVLPAGDPDALRDFTEERIAQFTGTHLVRLLTLTAATVNASSNGLADHHHQHFHSNASSDRHVQYR
jgi:hypothetical protein